MITDEDDLRLFVASIYGRCRSVNEMTAGGEFRYRAECTLHVRDIVARVIVGFKPKWRIVHPEVTCYERWIKRDINWHVYHNGELCWVHPKEWSIYNTSGLPTAKDSALYLLDNVSYLLEKHLISEWYDITAWDPKWSQYHHDQKEEKEINEWIRKFERRREFAAFGIPKSGSCQ